MFDENESSSDDRLDFFFLNLVGQLVTVFVDDGSVLQGLFISVDDDKQHLLLSKTRFCASLLHTSDDCAMVQDKVKLAFEHVIMMEAVQVAFRGASATRGANEHLTGPGAGQMKRWTEFSDDDEGDELEAKGSKKDKPWDQFETNQKKFGVKSTYQEELYTTKLNRDEFTPAQRAEADRVAREIEGSAVTGGIQHRAERGEDVGDDEGLMYSDVARTQEPVQRKPVEPLKRSAGAYVPPGARAKEDDRQKQNASPPTPPPRAVGNDGGHDDRAQHMSTTHAPRSNIPVPASQQHQQQQQQHHDDQPAKKLNATAREWKPGGSTPASPSAPESQVITDMLHTLASNVLASQQVKSCSPEWPDDVFMGGGGQMQSNHDYDTHSHNHPPMNQGGWQGQNQGGYGGGHPQQSYNNGPQGGHSHYNDRQGGYGGGNQYGGGGNHYNEQRGGGSYGMSRGGNMNHQGGGGYNDHNGGGNYGGNHQQQHHHHHHHHHHNMHQGGGGGGQGGPGPSTHMNHQSGPSGGGNMGGGMPGRGGGGMGGGAPHQHQDPNAGGGSGGYGNQGGSGTMNQGMSGRGGGMIGRGRGGQPQQPVPQPGGQGGNMAMAPQAIDANGGGARGPSDSLRGMGSRGRGRGGAPDDMRTGMEGRGGKGKRGM